MGHFEVRTVQVVGDGTEGRRADAERHYQDAGRQAAVHNFRAIGVGADKRLEDLQRGG